MSASADPDSDPAASPRRAAAQLHVIFARDADTAVVLRRGASRRTVLIGWNRLDDSFTVGEWMSARIDERRSDLSPDGKHLLYYALDGRWNAARRGPWTAISAVPWLKPLALFAKGDDWHGGGVFLDRRRYWLNDGPGDDARHEARHEVLHDLTDLTRVRKSPSRTDHGAGSEGVYFLRLQREGWRLIERRSHVARGDLTLFEKPLSDRWVLRKYAYASGARSIGKGVYRDTHSVVDARGGAETPQPEWSWADLDRERLVWVCAGRLHAADIDANGIGEPRLLADFNGMRAARVDAPY